MSPVMPGEPFTPANDTLGDPAVRRSLTDFVRRRVPSADVDDVVQTVLCDALAAPGRPKEPSELRRWLLGIARHKVVDFHRRAHREPPTELPDLEASPAPIEARELVKWAEKEAGSSQDAQRTLAWMAREGEGEKLEAIAEEEQLPPARVRQRVSRMRRWMKERWAAELAAVAMLAALAIAAWWLLRRQTEPPVTHDEPPAIAPETPSPLERARLLRADALRACDDAAWRTCLDGLDQARALDPDGDQAPAIGAARARAEDGLQGPPPTPSTAPVPTGVKDAPEKSLAPVPTAAPTSKPVLKSKPTPSDDGAFDLKDLAAKGTPGTGTGHGGLGAKPSGKTAPKKAIEKVLGRPEY